MVKKTVDREVDVAFGLPTHDGTYTWEFTHCLEAMIQHSTKDLSMAPLRRRKEPIAPARHGMAEDALEIGAKFLLFIDSDMCFPKDALSRLLAHDLDVVCGMYIRCVPPYNITSVTTEDNFENFDSVGMVAPLPKEPGLMKVDGAGTGFMLIKTSVFEKMSKPYFSTFRNKKGNEIGEDFFFCRKAKAEAGVQIYLDTSLEIGHVHPMTYWPKMFFQYAAAQERAKMQAEQQERMDDRVLDQIAANNKRTLDQKMDKLIT